MLYASRLLGSRSVMRHRSDVFDRRYRDAFGYKASDDRLAAASYSLYHDGNFFQSHGLALGSEDFASLGRRERSSFLCALET